MTLTNIPERMIELMQVISIAKLASIFIDRYPCPAIFIQITERVVSLNQEDIKECGLSFLIDCVTASQ